MKKLLFLLTVIALVMCVAACGSDKKGDSDTSSTESVTSSELIITTTMTADEYLEALKPSIDGLKQEFETQGFNFECSYDADEKALVYSYTYAMQVDADIMKGQIMDNTAAQGSTFQNSIDTIHKECPDIEKLTLVYKNADKSTIWTGHFIAK